MSLNFAGITLTVREEKLIRDNMAQPGQSIIQDALDSILVNCRAGTMTRAHEKYVDIDENGTAEQVAALPPYTNEAKMLAFYFKNSKTRDQRIAAKAAAAEAAE